MRTKAKPETKTTTRRGALRLTPTSTPGVFVNKAGTLVNEFGVALSFKEVAKRDEERWTEVLGKSVQEPADLLKAMALDPRLPLHERKDAAKAAAQYFTPKRVSVQGGGEGTPPIDLRVKDLPQSVLDATEKALRDMVDKVNSLVGGANAA